MPGIQYNSRISLMRNLLQPAVLASLFFVAMAVQGQRGAGEVRILVRDGSGLPLRASGELASDSAAVRAAFRTGADGRYVARPLVFGSYQLTINCRGFAAYRAVFELSSEVPLNLDVTLTLAGVQTAVTVSDTTTLLSPDAPRNQVGSAAIEERRASEPGWGVLDLIRTQPGWLLEANGVLHPRGSEYQTQYVVDGLPAVDNRSPVYAPGLETEEIQSVTSLTAGYPAEYGRKLGGVVEVLSRVPDSAGWHGAADWQAGSYGMNGGDASVSYSTGRAYVSAFGQGGVTDRYLDPPSLNNYTNNGWNGSAGGRFEYDLSSKDRVRFQASTRRAAFLVPNTDAQEVNGQRQDRRAKETGGQFAWTHVLSPALVLTTRGSVRDLSAELWSNPLSTPLMAGQDRGFREGYVSVALAAHKGRHELKAGTDLLISSVHEQFSYLITDPVTDPAAFDPETPASFQFQDQRRSREQSVFAQDEIRLGQFTVSAGLRWDLYRFLVHDQAWSPRLGVSWHSPRAGLVLRASYDRVFQTPAIENLLLASAPAAQHLTDASTGLPVPPSRGNFFETGFSKTLGSKFRLDGSYYWRRERDFADDDVFLNSGVSFPVSFAKAQIHGFEARLELPRWGRFSGILSYSNLNGVSFLPVTGGLFLEEGAAMLTGSGGFPITQDQRNTAYGRVRCQVTPRVWVASAGWYGSGLPFEQDGGSAEVTDPRILARVNLERGRTRPAWTMDVQAGADLVKRDRASVALQVDALNVTDQFNVINFNGLFSGTALAPSRTLAVRIHTRF